MAIVVNAVGALVLQGPGYPEDDLRLQADPWTGSVNFGGWDWIGKGHWGPLKCGAQGGGPTSSGLRQHRTVWDTCSL